MHEVWLGVIVGLVGSVDGPEIQLHHLVMYKKSWDIFTTKLHWCFERRIAVPSTVRIGI